MKYLYLNKVVRNLQNYSSLFHFINIHYIYYSKQHSYC